MITYVILFLTVLNPLYMLGFLVALLGACFTIDNKGQKMILIKNNGNFRHISKKEAEKIYLDFLNNYLTIEKMSEDYNVSYFSLQTIINNFRNKQL